MYLTQVLVGLMMSLFADASEELQNIETVEYQVKIEHWLQQVELDLSKFNSISASLTWKLSTTPDEQAVKEAMELAAVRNLWKNKICRSNVVKPWLTNEQSRKLYLLCRGPKFTEASSKQYLDVMGKLSEAYNSPICLPNNQPGPLNLLSYESQNVSGYPSPGQCLYGEPDLERLMKRNDLNADQLNWIWTTWHNFVGPKIKDVYSYSVFISNLAARNNGYHDIGEIWREELEIPNLEQEMFTLYEQVKPLYLMLHAVVRYKLRLKYGDEINPKGPVPVHLLGNMWGQDWSPLLGLFIPENQRIDLNKNLAKKNWTVCDMVLQAEDMYTSLSLPKMTRKFWKYSIFEENENTTMCHGTAANMFVKDDVRMLLCAQVNMEDFYVIHHEMGHIEYYMAYQDLPSIFQDGANSAFHESVGDALMHATMTPQHIHRLGLINDEELVGESLDLMLLLQQALAKIPEIPFALILDKYRWDLFSGKITSDNYNKAYWDLNEKIRGVIPPEFRGEEYFDAGAKFHVPDNTPYIRYFLSGILQMEIFKGLCEFTLFGRNPEAGNFTEANLMMPLHRCDIYGSKIVGRQLLKMMEKGSSQHWSETLKIVTGKDYITAKPFMEYFKPVYDWLEKYINVYKIPVGW